MDHLSWQWRPHIARCKLFLTLLGAELAVLTQFFLQNVSMVYVRKEAQNPKIGCFFFTFDPPEKAKKVDARLFAKNMDQSIYLASPF